MTGSETNRRWRMRMIRLLLCALMMLAPVTSGAQTLVRDVRAALDRHDGAAADALVAQARAKNGTTPEVLAAQSWLARGALTEKRYDVAVRVARDTEKQTLDAIKSTP